MYAGWVGSVWSGWRDWIYDGWEIPLNKMGNRATGAIDAERVAGRISSSRSSVMAYDRWDMN